MAAVLDALAPHVESGVVPGLVAVVARGDDVDVTVLGDQSIGGAPMREDSLFRIASADKPMTAAAVLTLVSDGRLTLDDPVDDLLPELAAPRVLRRPTAQIDDTVAAARPLTVGDLLLNEPSNQARRELLSGVVLRRLADAALDDPVLIAAAALAVGGARPAMSFRPSASQNE